VYGWVYVIKHTPPVYGWVYVIKHTPRVWYNGDLITTQTEVTSNSQTFSAS